LPPADNDDDALLDQPWFPVGDHDVFPEEHRRFLGLPPELTDVFLAHHEDLFRVGPWRQIQDRIRSGELIEVFPYHQEARLPGTGGSRGWQ
jgi:isocitrate dehydrogenase kinase/phosphatase